jgi:hypothetical protein
MQCLLLKVASGACGVNTHAVQRLVDTASRLDPEGVWRIVEDLTMRYGIAAQNLSWIAVNS